MMQLRMATDASDQRLREIPDADVTAGNDQWQAAMEMVNEADSQKTHSAGMVSWGRYALLHYWWTTAEGYFASATDGFDLASSMYGIAETTAREAKELYRVAE